MKQKLTDWYKQINEEDILPNGVIKINVPVIDTDVPIAPVEEPSDETLEKPGDSSVVAKDKDASLRSFIIAKQIQDSLVRLAGLIEPYETDSEERQKISDHIKQLHRDLGEELSCL